VAGTLRAAGDWRQRDAQQPGPGDGVATGLEVDDAGGEAMSAMATNEAAAAKEPGGPPGPMDAAWLILQRLDDLRRAQDDMRADLRALDAKLEAKAGALDAKIESVRTWSIGLLLLAVVGLLAKLLIPGA